MIERSTTGIMVYAEADIKDIETLNVDAFKFYVVGYVTPRGQGGSRSSKWCGSR